MRPTRDCVFIFTILAIFYFRSVNTVLSEKGLETTSKLIKTVCKSKSNVNETHLALMRSGTLVDDQTLRCYMSCALNMMKVMQNGKIDVESAKRQLDALMPARFKTPMTEQLEECKGAEGANSCEIAANFVKCSYNVNPNSTVIPL